LAYKDRDDRITLAGVKLRPRLGVTPEEKNNPQECEAEVTIWGNFEAAAATDCLEQSVDYCSVLAAVEQTAAAREYSLVETLAYRIVRDILQDFPVSRVRVRLRKRPTILASQVDFVEVEVEDS
jgi:dihydroneopterin aldolase